MIVSVRHAQPLDSVSTVGVSRRRRSSLHDPIMLPQFVISSAPLFFYEITDFTKVDM